MAQRPDQERFAYDFERPIIEIENQIRELTERGSSEHSDLGARIEKLEQKRGRLLEKTFKNLTAYQRVKLARHPLRPHPMDYVRSIFTDFIELHGDRRFGDDKAIVTGLGRLDDWRVAIIALQKGKDTKEKIAANFGLPQPEGYRKALHKMKLAEKFRLPVLCLIDTPGAACAIGAEERGEAMAIAENIYTMAGLRVPIIVLITGEGCSGGALGVGVGDRFAMLENAYYSVITPEGCAAILWHDGKKAPEAADALKLTARDMLDCGIIDVIIPEPLGGAHRDPQRAIRNVEHYLTETLEELAAIPIGQLLEERYQRYRRIGAFEEQAQPADDAAPSGEVRPSEQETA